MFLLENEISTAQLVQRYSVDDVVEKNCDGLFIWKWYSKSLCVTNVDD